MTRVAASGRGAGRCCVILAWACLAGLSACSLLPEPIEEDLPQPRAGWAGETRHLFWTEGGVVAVGAGGVRVVDLATGAVRVALPTSAVPASGFGAPPFVLDAAVSDAAQRAFFVADEATEARPRQAGRLFAVPLGGGAPEVLAEDVAAFAVADGGRRFALARPLPFDSTAGAESDSLVLLDGGAERGLGRGRPVAFSPTGDTLLYGAERPDGGRTPVLLDLRTGRADTLASFPNPFAFCCALSEGHDVGWVPGGVEVLLAEGDYDAQSWGLAVWSSRTGAVRRIWDAPGRETFDLVDLPVRGLPDGRAALAWTRRCYAGLFECDRDRYTLWHIDLVTGRAEALARTPDRFPRLAVSPDGRAAAFTLRSTRLYLLNLN